MFHHSLKSIVNQKRSKKPSTTITESSTTLTESSTTLTESSTTLTESSTIEFDSKDIFSRLKKELQYIILDPVDEVGNNSGIVSFDNTDNSDNKTHKKVRKQVL